MRTEPVGEHARGGDAVFGRNLLDRRVPEERTPRTPQRRVRRHADAVRLAERDQPLLRQQRVQLDLVHRRHRGGVRDQVFDVRHGAVGDADRLSGSARSSRTGGDGPWSSPWRRASPSPSTCRGTSSRAGCRACRRASSGTRRGCRSGSAGSASASGTGQRIRGRASRATRRAPPPRACATCPTASSSRTRPTVRPRPRRTRAQTRARPPPRSRTRTRSRRGGSPPPSARGTPPFRLRRAPTAMFLEDVSGGH